ncbi:MAG TPA: hypothetical protein IAA57_09700 [Candidatus Pullilachnospira intestinigallinarum]|nr:hypothetical protein [Candidatus Pullilachnospira intestinigallinarum]
MRRKVIAGIVVLILVLTAGIFWVSQQQKREIPEDALIFEGDGEGQHLVDLVIQGEDQILYMGQILLKDSSPTMEDVLLTIDQQEPGMEIVLDGEGTLQRINEMGDNWTVEIDNREIKEKDMGQIPVEDWQGITLRYSSEL